MSDTNETTADIIAEMETERPGLMNAPINTNNLYYARRLKAALKREVGALRQRCNELNAEVAAKDEVIKRLNDAIAEEQKRKMATAEKTSAVGDAAKLREAVIEARRFVFAAMQGQRDILVNDGINEPYVIKPKDTLSKVDAALAAPPRNCDVAKLREALKLCMDEMCSRCRDLAAARSNPLPCLQGCEPVRKAKAALAASPRNCDRPECATTKAAADVWRKEDGGKTAYHEWLLAPSTEKEGGNNANK